MTVTLNIVADTGAQLIADVRAIAGSSATSPADGGGTTTPPPVVTPPPVDANVYPFQMPAGITDRAPITLGTGPDSIVMNVASNPSGTILNQYSVIVVQGAARKGIVDTFTATSKGGASVSDAQNITLRGTWPGLSSIMISSAGVGLNGIWINSLAVNLIPWVSDGDAANSRGSGQPSYGTQIFNSNGANMVWYPPNSVALPPPTPPAPLAPPLTLIDGKTLAALITATATGATLTLPDQTIVGAGLVPNACIIAGSGAGNTIVDGTDLALPQNKAVLLIQVPGVTLAGMTIKGAAISTTQGNNAAGVRDNGDGTGFALDGVELTGNQNGALTFASNCTLKNGTSHDNGASDGFTHELYFGGSPTTTVSLENWTSTCGRKSTHALKSRAGTTTATASHFTGNPDDGTVGGSVVDIPDAGTASFTGGSITVAPGAGNTLLIGYAMESAKNAATGDTLTCTDVVFGPGIIQCGGGLPAGKLVLVGCTYTGSVAPEIRGFATVTGTITAAAV